MNNQISNEIIRNYIVALMVDGARRSADEIVSIISKEYKLTPAAVNKCLKTMCHSTRWFKRHGQPNNVRYELQKEAYPMTPSKNVPAEKEKKEITDIPAVNASPVVQQQPEAENNSKPSIDPNKILNPAKDIVEEAIYKVLVEGGWYSVKDLQTLLEDHKRFSPTSIGPTLSAVIKSPLPWVKRRLVTGSAAYMYHIEENVELYNGLPYVKMAGRDIRKLDPLAEENLAPVSAANLATVSALTDVPVAKKAEDQTEPSLTDLDPIAPKNQPDVPDMLQSALSLTNNEKPAMIAEPVQKEVPAEIPLIQVKVDIKGVPFTLPEIEELNEYFKKFIPFHASALVKPLFEVKGILLTQEEIRNILDQLSKL